MTGHWKWVYHEGGKLHDVGLNEDGSLHNPNGYPEDTVRTAVAGAEERSRRRRSAAAKKAAATRARRKEQLIYATARRIISRHVLGPRATCYICGRGLGDPESIKRGIGSECWQDILSVTEELRRVSDAAETG